jgi:hypothetical protein
MMQTAHASSDEAGLTRSTSSSSDVSGLLGSNVDLESLQGTASPTSDPLAGSSPVNVLPVFITSRFPRIESCVVVFLVVASVLLAAATLALQASSTLLSLTSLNARLNDVVCAYSVAGCKSVVCIHTCLGGSHEGSVRRNVMKYPCSSYI